MTGAHSQPFWVSLKKSDFGHFRQFSKAPRGRGVPPTQVPSPNVVENKILMRLGAKNVQNG